MERESIYYYLVWGCGLSFIMPTMPDALPLPCGSSQDSEFRDRRCNNSGCWKLGPDVSRLFPIVQQLLAREKRNGSASRSRKQQALLHVLLTAVGVSYAR